MKEFNLCKNETLTIRQNEQRKYELATIEGAFLLRKLEDVLEDYKTKRKTTQHNTRMHKRRLCRVSAK